MFNQEKFAQILELVKSKNNLGEEIYIVGATKTISIDEINLAISKGLKIVAENRVQEFREKTDLIVGASQHFIGHLQTNKVKYLVGKVDLIHSIDSFHLASAVSECAKRKNIVQDVLVEINIGGELSKSGINPQNAISEIEKISSLDGIKVKGLMAMLPKTRDKEKLQALTLQMREIFDIIKKDNPNITYLSVGMSSDYDVAIKNGSNMIRLGSAIFGERNYGEKNGNI